MIYFLFPWHWFVNFCIHANLRWLPWLLLKQQKVVILWQWTTHTYTHAITKPIYTPQAYEPHNTNHNRPYIILSWFSFSIVCKQKQKKKTCCSGWLPVLEGRWMVLCAVHYIEAWADTEESLQRSATVNTCLWITGNQWQRVGTKLGLVCAGGERVTVRPPLCISSVRGLRPENTINKKGSSSS